MHRLASPMHSDTSSHDTSFQRALDYADDAIESLPQLFGCSLLDLGELDAITIAIELMPGVETVIPQPDTIFHRVSETAARELYFEGLKNPDAYDVALEICVRNLRNDAPLPWILRQFLIAEMTGQYKRVKRVGPKPKEDFARRWFLYAEANYIADAFGLYLTRNEASSDASACDALVNSAEIHGLSIKYTTLRDWCGHEDYTGFRRKADGFTDFIKDRYLEKIGVIRARRP